MYEITIKRDKTDGILKFISPNKEITTKCYWNLMKKIPAGAYLKCSATTMSRKKNSRGNPREAIFIPGVVGFTEIFVHMGKPPYPKWSDGCVVIDENIMIEIYNAITPKNGHNVTITIKD